MAKPGDDLSSRSSNGRQLLFYGPEDISTWEAGLADCLDLSDASAWSDLQARYETGRSERTHNLLPWRRCLHVARASGAKSAVIERRYICYDYQSEFSAFYAHVLAGLPTTSHRIHFFSSHVTKADYRELKGDQKAGYLGYIVCRPRDLEIVGRTVLKPPPGYPVLTAVEDTPTFFGQELKVNGVPFMQQDERLGVCANVVAWMVHYTAYRKSQVSRRFVAEFQRRALDFSPKAAVGLDPFELLGLLDGVGFRTELFPRDAKDDIPETRYPWDPEPTAGSLSLSPIYRENPPPLLAGRDGLMNDSELLALKRRLVDECCRNLNSGIPLIADSFEHTFVVCGYRLTEGESVANFVVQDDQVGPYINVPDCLFDRYDLREAQALSVTDRAASLAEVSTHLFAGTSPDPSEEGHSEWSDWMELLVPLPSRVFSGCTQPRPPPCGC